MLTEMNAELIVNRKEWELKEIEGDHQYIDGENAGRCDLWWRHKSGRECWVEVKTFVKVSNKVLGRATEIVKDMEKLTTSEKADGAIHNAFILAFFIDMNESERDSILLRVKGETLAKQSQELFANVNGCSSFIIELRG